MDGCMYCAAALQRNFLSRAAPATGSPETVSRGRTYGPEASTLARWPLEVYLRLRRRSHSPEANSTSLLNRQTVISGSTGIQTTGVCLAWRDRQSTRCLYLASRNSQGPPQSTTASSSRVLAVYPSSMICDAEPMYLNSAPSRGCLQARISLQSIQI